MGLFTQKSAKAKNAQREKRQRGRAVYWRSKIWSRFFLRIRVLIFLFFLYLFRAEANDAFFANAFHFQDLKRQKKGKTEMQSEMDEDSGDLSPKARHDAKVAEIRHFETVVKSFLYYEHHGNIFLLWSAEDDSYISFPPAARFIEKGETSFARLPAKHQKLLHYLPQKFQAQKNFVKVGTS